MTHDRIPAEQSTDWGQDERERLRRVGQGLRQVLGVEPIDLPTDIAEAMKRLACRESPTGN